MFDFLKKKKCDHCRSWKSTKLVKNPAELSTLIKRIRADVNDGKLIAFPPTDDGFQEEFNSIPNKAPWSDIILNYFECSNCKAKFKLFADTYHGSNRNGWYKE